MSFFYAGVVLEARRFRKENEKKKLIKEERGKEKERERKGRGFPFMFSFFSSCAVN